MNKTLQQLYREHSGKVSDKWSLYLAEYDRLFSSYRKLPIRLLEIGIQNGGSLEIWSRFFSNAERFIGCDIDPNCARLQYDDPRIVVVVADANKASGLRQVLAHCRRFEIIIDDGSHSSQDVVQSFAGYFPYLEDGGLYVIEDLHCSYWKEYYGQSHNSGGLYHPDSSLSFFKKLLDVINHEHWGTDKSRSEFLNNFKRRYRVEFDEGLLRTIHSIEILNSFCVVNKRQARHNELGARVVVGGAEAVSSGLRSLHRSFSAAPDQRRNRWAIDNAESAIDEELRLAEAAELETLAGELNAGRAETALARQQLAAVQQELAEAESASAMAQQQLAGARSELEIARSDLAQRNGIITGLQTDITRLERERDDAAAAGDRLTRDLSRAQAEARVVRDQLAAIETSTIWQATRPIRRILEALPPGPRRLARRTAQLVWWSATLQLPAKLQESKRARTAASAQAQANAAEPRSFLNDDRETAPLNADALEVPFEIWRSPASLTDRDVCLFVTYSPNGQIWDYVLHYLNALIAEQFAVVLVIATEGIEQTLPPQLERLDGILVRANHGWDFAAWAAALAVFPDLWTARRLVLANDSVYGPIDRPAFNAVLRRVRSSEASVVALTDSHEHRHHLQSYFIALTRSGLNSPAIRQFWAGVRSLSDKEEVINAYEVTFLEHLRSYNVSCEVLFPTERDGVRQPLNNPTIADWSWLLDRGLPFLKVQLIRDRPPQGDPTGWETRITDPLLLRQIQAHLAQIGEVRAGPSVHRPIPPPWRRFKRNFDLQTSYGAIPACRPTDATDLALEVPFRYSLASDKIKGVDRVAVIAHLFHAHMSQQFLDAINNIPIRADLYLSTDTDEKRDEIAAVFESYRNGSVEIRVWHDRGRDIAAMLVGYADVIAQYEILLHVHSKASPHNPQLTSWRDFLLANLLGSTDIVHSILEILSTTDVGVVFSQHFPAVRGILNFGMNFETMKGLLGKAGIRLDRDLVLEFPSGSFFWANRKALQPFLAMSLDWSDFPPEPLPVDGTLGHAIERAMLYFCEATGQRWVKVARNADGIDAETLIPVFRRSEIETAVTRAHRWLIGNPIRPPKAARRLSEVNLVPTRRDLTRQPRLNVIVPNLMPHGFFGGLTTAINLFAELERQLGESFAYRIISIGEPIDLLAMTRFPDYRLVSIGAVFDRFAKTVVDAGDSEIGELSLRADDIFIATAWWTAVTAYDLQAAQRLRHGRAHPVIYLIQDHEPDFYGWSSRYAMAQQTYTCPADKIAIINSEELTEYVVRRYGLEDVYTLPFTVNPIIRKAIKPTPRERIILVYGRPLTPRNCFEVIVQALALWQRSEPNEALRWNIVSAGEPYDADAVTEVKNLTVLGKLPLDEYGKLLSRASVGISFMVSPHPSYPPLEMAFAGMVTITNKFETKDPAKRSPNIIAVSDVIPNVVADALSLAVHRADAFIGSVLKTSEIAPVPTAFPAYDAAEFALRLSRMVGGPESRVLSEVAAGE